METNKKFSSKNAEIEYISGTSLQKISREKGIPLKQLQNWSQQFNWPARRRDFQRTQKDATIFETCEKEIKKIITANLASCREISLFCQIEIHRLVADEKIEVPDKLFAIAKFSAELERISKILEKTTPKFSEKLAELMVAELRERNYSE